MEIIKLSVLILVAVTLSNGLPVLSKEISVFITFACCTVVLLYVVEMMLPAIEYIKSIAEKFSDKGMETIIKAVGVGFITQFVSDTAMDNNNRVLANQMVLAGKICVLVLAFPILMEVFVIIEKLIGFV